MAIKGSIHQKDTTIIHILACNNRAPKYMKPKLTKLERKKDNSVVTETSNSNNSY